MMNELIMDSIRYTVDNLNELPDDLSPRHFCEKSSGSCFVFGRIVSEFGFLSNWYPCEIHSDDRPFRSLEQAYQFHKAVYCGEASALKLQHTTDPRSAKDLGEKICGLDNTDWEKERSDVMLELVKVKFSDPVIKAELLKPGNL